MKTLFTIICAFILIFNFAISEEVLEEPTVEIIESTPEPISTVEPNIISDTIEFDEDDWGEITIEFKREIYVSVLREPKQFGDIITLVVSLVNFKPDDHYTIVWQYSMNGKDWTSIAGEDERTYTFILDQTNCKYFYRVLVIVEE